MAYNNTLNSSKRRQNIYKYDTNAARQAVAKFQCALFLIPIFDFLCLRHVQSGHASHLRLRNKQRNVSMDEK